MFLVWLNMSVILSCLLHCPKTAVITGNLYRLFNYCIICYKLVAVGYTLLKIKRHFSGFQTEHSTQYQETKVMW